MHDHRQHPSGRSAAAAGAPRLLAVLGLVVAFLAVEAIAGVLTGSLALLADAGHMLTDAAGLAMALLAVWFARRPPTQEKSFGYYRVEILAALANGILLLVVAGLIVAEAIRRITEPPAVASVPMLAVAAVGLAVNIVSMRLLAAGQARSLNLRGAYLEVLGDLLGSVAVILAGAVILTTGVRLADPIASMAIAVLILPRTWTLLRDAVDILLQATPRDVDVDEVRRHIAGTAGVVDTHDLHAWTLTSGIRVVSAHVVIAPDAIPARVLDELERCLCDDFDMEHSTLQLETVDRRRWEHATHS